MTRLRDEGRRERLRAAWGSVSVADFAAAEQTSVGAIYRLARELGLPARPRGRPPLTSGGKRSFPSGGAHKRHIRPTGNYGSVILAPTHRAIRKREPLFTHRIVGADDPSVKFLLVSGKNNRKLSDMVRVGRWKGMPIYHLTLPERMTCPTSCQTWASCYGNQLHLARRHLLDDALIKRLGAELAWYSYQHRSGFVVRLHTLGDFGAPEDEALALRYVRFWMAQLHDIPQLHIFGFTAHPPETQIGAAIMAMTRDNDRCWIRFSGHGSGRYGARVIDVVVQSEHVVCPYEQAKVEDCGDCGLCWTMSRTVEFVRH